MGLPVKVPPTATFYIWLDLSHLSAPLNNGLTFFEELLKVCHDGTAMRAPPLMGLGEDDLRSWLVLRHQPFSQGKSPSENRGPRRLTFPKRNLFHSPCHHFVRLSFGPNIETLDKGLDAIERVLKRHEQDAHLTGKKYAVCLPGDSYANQTQLEEIRECGRPGHEPPRARGIGCGRR